MRKLLKVILIVASVLCLFPKVASAKTLKGYVLFYDEAFNKVHYSVCGDTSEEVIDSIIVAVTENDVYLDFLQGDIEIMQHSFEEGHLIISFSNDVLFYGGTSNEYYMTQTLLTSFLSVEGVECVSFYIDGGLSPFCEGTVIFMEEYDEI